jgi:hypothetical protein
MSFQDTVMSISITLLIIVLCFIGIALYNQKYKTDYPPTIANCPDYWEDQSEGNNGAKCVNVKNLGNPSCSNTMDFSTAQWAGGDAGKCNKSKWATTCNLTWDGISDNTDICGV